MNKITGKIKQKIYDIRKSHYKASSWEKTQTVGAFILIEIMVHSLQYVFNDILHYTQEDYEGFTEWVLIIAALTGVFSLIISDTHFLLRKIYNRKKDKHKNETADSE